MSLAIAATMRRRTSTKTTQPAGVAPRDKSLLYELKGPLKATPDRAEFPDFDLTIHAKGHPQIFKGKLTFDFGERVTANGALTAGFVDLDALFASPGAEAAAVARHRPLYVRRRSSG